MAFAVAMTVAGQPAAAQDGGALVAKDGECAGSVPTSSGELTQPYIISTDSIVLKKGNGSLSVTCHFDIPAAQIPLSTTRAEGFECIVAAGISTYNSRLQASSGGKGTLSCRWP